LFYLYNSNYYLWKDVFLIFWCYIVYSDFFNEALKMRKFWLFWFLSFWEFILDLSFQMSLDPHIVLNEEMTPPPKYESYSSGLKNISDTLDEPVLDTIVLNHLPRKEMLWKYTIRLA